MRYDDGFCFSLRQKEGAYYISGEYTQPSEGLLRLLRDLLAGTPE